MNISNKRMQKFYDSFEFAPNGCWLWTGLTHHGYGLFTIGRKLLRAHRVAYELYKGPIPEGLVIDHLCQVKNCVNPEHLEAVTQRENVYRAFGYGDSAFFRTHCKYGHSLTGSNIYIIKAKNGRGTRTCRTCRNERKRRKRLEIKLASAS